MTSKHEHLDRAIVEGRKAEAKTLTFVMFDVNRPVFAFERTYASAVIRELFANLEPPADATCYERDMWEDTLATILQTAGIEGDEG